ncbi:hypothetical protein IJS77_04175 [bacterium]|nr:hypothetical protein [bacterium]
MNNDENIYRINLKNAITASDLIYDLSMSLEKDEVKNKKIFLQMNDIDLSIAQLKSIRSLINSINSSLSFISTNSEMTKASAMALEIVISNEDTNLSAKLEPEKTYMTVDEAIEKKSDSVEETQKVISIETEDFTHEDAQNALESIFETKSEADTEQKETPAVEENLSVEQQQQQEINDDYKIVENEETSKNEESESINPLDSIFESEKKFEEIIDIQPVEEGTAPDIEYYKNLDNEFTQEDLEIDGLPTMYVKHTLRSGQVINYEGNVVIIGDCHTGSEVHATGDVTVWGVLSGIVHAGSLGNTRAKIRALKMNAIQLRIADSYARKPDALNSVLIEKTNVFTPEEARYIDGDIIIFKIND